MSKLPATPAVGTKRRNHVRIMAALEPDQFERIRAMAARDGCSLCETIRTVLEWGFMSADEADRAIPDPGDLVHYGTIRVGGALIASGITGAKANV